VWSRDITNSQPGSGVGAEKAVANGPHTESRRDAQCGAHLANKEKEEVCEMDEEVASEDEEERERLIRRRRRRRRVDPKPTVIFALVDKNRTVFRAILLMTYVSHKTRLVKVSPPPRRRKDAVKSGTTKSVHKEWPQLGNN